MKAEKLLQKINKLNSIYNRLDAEIEAFDVDININIVRIWQKRRRKLMLNLINKSEKETVADFFKWVNSFERLAYTKVGMEYYIDRFFKEQSHVINHLKSKTK